MLFSAVMQHRTRSEWEEVFIAAGVPAGPINDYSQAIVHPVAKHQKTRIGIPHALGVDAPGIANPMRFSKSPVSYRRPPPLLGQHTLEVLREFGLDDAAIEALQKSGAIRLS